MDEAVCIREFIKLAERLGIEIRYTVDVPSGLCMVKGKRIFFIDKTLDPPSTLSLFVREMKTLKPLEGVFVVPLLRKHLGLEDETSEW
jgi:hypoxanthine phosphoribosyltransferase